MSIVAVRGLTKRYPSFTLDSVSFSLEAGRIAGFIGRNGAGKTTTIKAMLNLIHPNAGEIRFFGLPLIGNEAAIKQRIGYSTGAVNYYPKKTIRQIVAITKSFYPTWNDADYKTYAALFELDENKRPCELSEGMKVKFNLLLALAHGAEILILDEPTSGLDPFARDELLDVFGELKARGVAVLFSTHITSDLEKCADDIIFISRGRIVDALPKAAFVEKHARENETLEETILRLEKERKSQ